ncbi:MAG: tail fiber domain-containing protein, partial [Bacteroidota bacterium]|nr:tail fiber domain-containing protein [Bacteroidota bacterium]
TSGTGVGVYGETSGGGAGVTTNSGVCGSTSSGIGVAGNASSGTGTKGYSSSTGIGIYGITGAGATTARAAVFEQNGSGTTGNVVEATCIGTGKAGYFQINNVGNTATAFDAATNGTSNTSHAIVGTHSANTGLGVGVKGITNSTTGGNAASSATGVWGEVTPAGPGAFSAGVRGINNGTAGNGVGVVGYHAGNGYGMFGTVAGAAGGVGVYAAAPAGSWALYSAGKFEVNVDNAVKPTTNTWTIASDARLKNVLRPFSDGLDVLLKINPIWYRYNGLAGLPTETENIGILAQDMKLIAPYTVGTAQVKLHPDDAQTSEILTYNSHAITYVTINAIKELNQKITDLQQRLDAMEQLLQANGIDPNANGPISHK